MTRSSSEPAPAAGGSLPVVSVVVVVFNSPDERLRRCVSALRASVDVAVEIIIVDNASSPPAHLDLADRTVLRASNGGFAAGANDGIRVAKGAWIAIVNDDAVVQPGVFAKCVAALEAAPATALAAAPKVLFAGTDGAYIDSCGLVIRPTGEAFSAGAGQPDLGQFDDDTTVLGPCLSAAVFRREAFDRVGLLDERYFLYYEDVDWALRCHLSGHSTLLVPGAVVHHEHAASTRLLGERRRFRMVQRNLLLCATANLSWHSVVHIWTGRLTAAAKAAVKGPDRSSLGHAVATATWRAPSALVARGRRRSRAVVADADAFSFADGLTPFVDSRTYRPNDVAAASQAAIARRARAGLDR
jgi:GT2 family glycosyltransferase